MTFWGACAGDFDSRGSFLGNSRLSGETYGEVFDDFDLLGKLLLLVTHNVMILVYWTHGEVLDHSDPFGEDFSIYVSLKSCLMVLTHKGVFLVTSNPLGSVLRPSNLLGNVFNIFHVFQPVEKYLHHFGATFVTFRVPWSIEDTLEFFLTFPTLWEFAGYILICLFHETTRSLMEP